MLLLTHDCEQDVCVCCTAVVKLRMRGGGSDCQLLFTSVVQCYLSDNAVLLSILRNSTVFS